MNLERGLRREDDACAAADANRLPEPIAAEHARPGADDDQIGGIADRERASDAQRRLGVRVRDNRASAAPLEDKLEPRVAADLGWNP